MALSIKDIARLSGVSTATVSRTLSQPEKVAEETRQQVMAVVETYGYRINSSARNLRRQRTDAVLALVPDLNNPFFSAIFRGLQDTLAGAGRDLLVSDSLSSRDHGRPFLSHLLAHRVDGLVCFDGAIPAPVLQDMATEKLRGRVVFACEWPQEGAFPSVRSDNAGGAVMAVDHLLELGHRDIAFLSGPRENVLTISRHQAVAARLAEKGLHLGPDRVHGEGFSLEAGQAAAAWVAGLDSRPTAVICASDQLAIGLASGLHAFGLRVPDDLSIVGFDDIATAAYVLPALTTVRQDRPGLGAAAARLLLARLDGAHLPEDEVVTLPVELCVRQSTGPAPKT